MSETLTQTQLEAVSIVSEKIEELQEEERRLNNSIKEVERQLKAAENDLAIRKLESAKLLESKEKTENELKETFKIEKERLAEVMLKKQKIEEELGSFVASVEEEKADLVAIRDQNAKALIKLEELKNTNEAISNDKKEVLAQIKRETSSFEAAKLNAGVQIEAMQALEAKLFTKDKEITSQIESIQFQHKDLQSKKEELENKERELSGREARLAVRELRMAPEETRLLDLIKVQEEKETFLIKLQEELKLKGVVVEEAKVEEAKVEEAKVELTDKGTTVSWKSKKTPKETPKVSSKKVKRAK